MAAAIKGQPSKLAYLTVDTFRSHACRTSQFRARMQTYATASASPKITLYTFGTPNGQKASIGLEELGLKYKVVEVDITENVQKEEWFLKINPNGRIPAIVDHSRGDFPVFETGAILMYLAEHHDPKNILLSEDANKRSEAIQWLNWQMGGLGPMQGQANHFFRYAPENIPYAIKRYQDETKRLYSVMERQLSDGREYLIGEYSLADVACFGWGLSLEELPLVDQWLHRAAKRPAVLRGMNVPRKNNLIENDFKV
ncbi:glutathione S-transferase [Fimicolochytrium jonesii]|uniref:glutathione S-transferase n=1 Tax=Fimicolochytrium jonesii TaxID=1396493 RepID=UPI0022FED0AC|nr:glutathione S-transferase [Fimicolochytrium jonesii]KAI8821646.1 glutathione S-transferase [Fimicolochytrium jonesii]